MAEKMMAAFGSYNAETALAKDPKQFDSGDRREIAHFFKPTRIARRRNGYARVLPRLRGITR
jgi:hypothetical protein